MGTKPDLSYAEIIERTVAGRVQLDDGTDAFRIIEDDRPKAPRRMTKARWPMTSECGLGCHELDIEENNRWAQAQGLTGVHWERDPDVGDGVCVISDPGQRAKLLEQLRAGERHQRLDRGVHRVAIQLLDRFKGRNAVGIAGIRNEGRGRHAAARGRAVDAGSR